MSENMWKKTKDVNVKVFDTTTNKNETKTMKNEKNIFHVLVNENSVVQHVIQSKNWIMKHVNVM